MNNLLEFISSEEVMIVGVIIFTSAILALIVFLIEKSYYKIRQKNNVKLINKIVEKTQEQEALSTPDAVLVDQGLETTAIEDTNTPKVDNSQTVEEKPLVIPIEEFEQTEAIQSNQKDSIESIYNEVKEEVEQLQYTNPEPDKEEAKAELRKVTEELIKQEQESEPKNIDLTKFEAEQEENAIISLDELMRKSEILYQKNEETQYKDEGNEPISLDDLEQRMNSIKLDIIDLNKEIEEPVEKNTTVQSASVKLDDISTIDKNNKAYREDIVFKSSPIISPIFGIEENNSETSLELENTANYDKLDEEIKKTNQFLVTLKELQKKLD